MKRFTCFVLTLVLLMTGIVLPQGGAAAAEEDSTSLSLLSQLGILEILPEEADYAVSRGQMLSWLLSAVKEDFTLSSDLPVFYDVPENHLYHDTIVYAYESGYISGNGRGYFYPDDAVTAEEAAVMAIRIMGYEAAAEGAYMSLAVTLDLFDGCNVGSGNTLTRADAERMIYNLLMAPYPEQTYGTRASLSFGETTFLERIWGMESDIGIVEATAYESLYGKFAAHNKAMVEGITYDTLRFSLDGMLGMQVKVFYTIEEDERILAHAQTVKNEVKTFTEHDFAGISGQTIYFIEGRREVRHSINASTTVLYNGKVLRSLNLEERLSAPGSDITLIDNDNDGVYDVVQIRSASVYAPTFIDGEREQMNDRVLPMLSVGGYSKYRITDTEGKAMLMAECKTEWRYLVYDPGDTAYPLLITVEKGIAEGTVESADETEGTVTLTSGETYPVYGRSKVTAAEMESGKQYTFSLDAKGRVIDADETGVSMYQPLYMMSSMLKNFGAVDIMGMNGKGEYTVYSLASKVSIRGTDGVTQSLTPKATLEQLEATDPISLGRFFFARVNKANEIQEILQIVSNPDMPYHLQDYQKMTSNNKRRWMIANYSLENQIQLRSNTQLFVVPYAELPKQENKYYTVGSVGLFKNNDAYAINEYYPRATGQLVGTPIISQPGELAADYLLLECPEGQGFEAATTKYGLITGYHQMINEEDGNIYTVLRMLNHAGIGIEVKCEMGVEEMISIGDVVQINDKSTAATKDDILIYYDRSEDKINYFTFYDAGTGVNEIGYRYWAGFRVTKGKVLKISGDYAYCELLNTSALSKGKEYINLNSGQIITFRLSRGDYQTRSVRYLQPGDEFTAVMSDGKFRYILEFE